MISALGHMHAYYDSQPLHHLLTTRSKPYVASITWLTYSYVPSSLWVFSTATTLTQEVTVNSFWSVQTWIQSRADLQGDL